MRILRAIAAVALVTAAPSVMAAPPVGSAAVIAPPLEAVPRAALCMTEGAASPTTSGRGVHVEAGGVRAVIAGDRSHSAELAFTYLGPSAFAAPLANGEMRRQIGLKLRAQDTCNVVYVMWHLEPTQTIAVSVKHNAGEKFHSQCGAGGYDNLTPDASARAPVIERGVPHVLRADLDGNNLRVTADGIVVWRGHLPPAASGFDGPAGFRTDNGSFDLELRVPGGRKASGLCR